MFNDLVSNFSYDFHTTHGQNKTNRFNTEDFVQVDSLCGVVGSPYELNKCLIGRTGNM